MDEGVLNNFKMKANLKYSFYSPNRNQGQKKTFRYEQFTYIQKTINF